MSSLLSFAEELERRDAELERSLAEVERLRAEVGELRARATAVATYLEELPAALDESRADIEAADAAYTDASAARSAAEQALERATRDDERLAADRAVAEAARALAEADGRQADALARHAFLGRGGVEHRAEADRLASEAAALAPRVHDVPAPGPGLAGTIDWVARARGALLVARAGLAVERDAVVREASELLGGVLGDPHTATAVAGVRSRVERALRGGGA